MLFGDDLALKHKSVHDSSIFKGLAAFIGIYIFYLVETLMQSRRSKSNNKVNLTMWTKKNHLIIQSFDFQENAE